MVAVRLQSRITALWWPSETAVKTLNAHMNCALESCSVVVNIPLARLQVLRKQGFLSGFHDFVNILVEGFRF